MAIMANGYSPYYPYTSLREISALRELLSPFTGNQFFETYMQIGGMIRHRVVYQSTFGEGSYPFIVNERLKFSSLLSSLSQGKNGQAAESHYDNITMHVLGYDSGMIDNIHRSAMAPTNGALQVWLKEFVAKNKEWRLPQEETFLIGIATLFALSGRQPFNFETHESDPHKMILGRGFGRKEVDTTLKNMWNECHLPRRIEQG